MTRLGIALATAGLAGASLAFAGWLAWPRGSQEPEDVLAARLQALGYVEWAEAEDGRPARGVVSRDAARSEAGLNLFGSRGVGRAWLVDMDGATVHTWESSLPEAHWNHIEPLADGGLLVIDRASAIERLERDSRTRWRVTLGAHHDLDVDAEGRIYALVAGVGSTWWDGRELPIIVESVVVLSPEGEVLRTIALDPLLQQFISEEQLDALASAARGPLHWWRRLRGEPVIEGTSDVYHANSIELLDRDVPGLGERGDALISLRNLDRVAVIDLEGPKLLWSAGPGLVDAQHHASLLPSGNLLLFDNGRSRGWSRVIELDPAGELAWAWSGLPPATLFSRQEGAAQRLPSGNVLVTESQQGRAYEVTPDGRVVWEFANPEIDPDRGARRAISRMTRIFQDDAGSRAR
ncbi:MAG: arylsulfotransferase family protein [Myxococcota bacterium]